MLRATDIIRLFDGLKATAEVVGLTKNGVQRWTYPKDKGGYGDVVPPRHWAAVVLHARAIGKPIRIEDLSPDGDALVEAGRKRRATSGAAA